MKRMSSLVQILCVMTLVVTTSALTNLEIVYLLNNEQFTNSLVADFQISVLSAERLRINISGEPRFAEGACYNTSLGCCLPNTMLRPRAQVFDIPRRPVVGNETYCAPQGPVGVSIGGVAFYNHFENNCMDVNNFMESNLDSCNGRRGVLGNYQFHVAPRPECVEASPNSNSHIIGVALDGFPIYSSNMYNGFPQVLDECGGFMVNGERDNYRYVASYSPTKPFDHVIPCFKGVPIKPRCCECRECSKAQLPGCERRARPPTSFQFPGRPQGGRPQGGRPQGGRPQGGFPGRPQGGRPQGGRPQGGRPQGGFPFGGPRPGGNGSMIPDFEPQEGFCSRDQLMMLFQMHLPFGEAENNCTGCMECVPEGGYSTAEEAKRCRQCKIQMEISSQIGFSPFGTGRPPRGGRGQRNNNLLGFLFNGLRNLG